LQQQIIENLKDPSRFRDYYGNLLTRAHNTMWNEANLEKQITNTNIHKDYKKWQKFVDQRNQEAKKLGKLDHEFDTANKLYRESEFAHYKNLGIPPERMYRPAWMDFIETLRDAKFHYEREFGKPYKIGSNSYMPAYLEGKFRPDFNVLELGF
jgi:hypothetical protein